MLVHICCSVDSHFFLEKLQADYPDEKLIGFFYDPNIHPYSEYRLRLLDVQRSCRQLGIDLIEGEYDYENWLEIVRGLENEPEKGKRCERCFDRRFEVSAYKALELGETKMTTTLLVSPLKSQQQLQASGDAFYARHGVAFIAVDYRSGGGTQDQSRVSKEQKLYRQDYCGCMFGLTLQREQQGRLMDEMISPISNIVLPASIEARLALYEERLQLEENHIAYEIIKEKFLNYRQFTCKLTVGKSEVVAAYALCYSTLPRKNAYGKIEHTLGDLHYLNRDEVRFLTLAAFNKHMHTDYLHVKALIYQPPPFHKELQMRRRLLNDPFDLSPVIVLDTIPQKKIMLELDAKLYEDTQERIHRKQ